jgi:hypothetical protein
MQAYEVEFKHTLDNKRSIPEMAASGMVYEVIAQYPQMLEIAMNREYTGAIVLGAGEWRLPSGAFGESNGSM